MGHHHEKKWTYCIYDFDEEPSKTRWLTYHTGHRTAILGIERNTCSFHVSKPFDSDVRTIVIHKKDQFLINDRTFRNPIYLSISNVCVKQTVHHSNPHISYRLPI